MSPLDGQITDFVQAPATVPDVFSLDGLIAWLETQPADEPYDYYDSSDCLYCRYLRHRGIAVRSVGGYGFRLADGTRHPLTTFGELNIEVKVPWTYGAALSRARALRDRVTP